MKIKLIFNTRNSAFEDDIESEVRIIFKQAADKAIHQINNPPSELLLCKAPELNDKLLDSNGNTVGIIKVKHS